MVFSKSLRIPAVDNSILRVKSRLAVTERVFLSLLNAEWKRYAWENIVGVIIVPVAPADEGAEEGGHWGQ